MANSARHVSPCPTEGKAFQSLPKPTSKENSECVPLDFSVTELPTTVQNERKGAWYDFEDDLLRQQLGSFSASDVLPSYCDENLSPSSSSLSPSSKFDSMMHHPNKDFSLKEYESNSIDHAYQKTSPRNDHGFSRYDQRFCSGENPAFALNDNSNNERRVVQTPYGLAVLMSEKQNQRSSYFRQYPTKSKYSSSQFWNPSIEIAKNERWSAKEDAVLQYAIKREGDQAPFNWKKIATNYFSNKRSGLQCKNRWLTVSFGENEDFLAKRLSPPPSHISSHRFVVFQIHRV